MNERGGGAFLRVIGLLALVATVGVLGFLALVRREQHVAIGGEILHDDFGFRVVDSRPLEAALVVEGSTAPVTPKGRFLVVSLQVNNHAKRVPFALAGWAPVLVDADDHVFEPDAVAQTALASREGDAAKLEGSIVAGDSTTKLVVYDVPTDARELKLVIHWGGDIVNTIEPLIFGAKDITLNAAGSETAPAPSVGR